MDTPDMPWIVGVVEYVTGHTVREFRDLDRHRMVNVI